MKLCAWMIVFATVVAATSDVDQAPMPGFSRQIRIFTAGPSGVVVVGSSQTSDEEEQGKTGVLGKELGKELGAFTRLLSALEPMQLHRSEEEDDDDRSRSPFGSSFPQMFLQLMASRSTSPCSRPCTSDVDKYCGHIVDRNDNPFFIRMCLNVNSASLTNRCTEALTTNPTVIESCHRDITQHCSDVSPGENRIHSCLSSHQLGLSATCQSYFHHQRQLAEPLKTPSAVSTRWIQLKSKLETAKDWVLQNKQTVGIGTALSLLCLLLLIHAFEYEQQYRADREKEEFMREAGYELMWDQDDIEI